MDQQPQDAAAALPKATREQRLHALDAAVARELAAGARLADRTDYQAIVTYGGGAVHLVIALITAGVWLLLYPLWRERRYIIAVNESGRVWRRSLRDDKWERIDQGIALPEA